jgi:hypothetical protein
MVLSKFYVRRMKVAALSTLLQDMPAQLLLKVIAS